MLQQEQFYNITEKVYKNKKTMVILKQYPQVKYSEEVTVVSLNL